MTHVFRRSLLLITSTLFFVVNDHFREIKAEDRWLGVSLGGWMTVKTNTVSRPVYRRRQLQEHWSASRCGAAVEYCQAITGGGNAPVRCENAPVSCEIASVRSGWCSDGRQVMLVMRQTRRLHRRCSNAQSAQSSQQERV